MYQGLSGRKYGQIWSLTGGGVRLRALWGPVRGLLITGNGTGVGKRSTARGVGSHKSEAGEFSVTKTSMLINPLIFHVNVG